MSTGTPPDLVAEAQALSAEIVGKVAQISEDASATNLSLDELCPACHAPISLADIASAVCPNGHHWRKCLRQVPRLVGC